jgi:hypothetical protein
MEQAERGEDEGAKGEAEVLRDPAGGGEGLEAAEGVRPAAVEVAVPCGQLPCRRRESGGSCRVR